MFPWLPSILDSCPRGRDFDREVALWCQHFGASYRRTEEIRCFHTSGFGFSIRKPDALAIELAQA